MSRREFLTKLTGAGAAAFLMDWAAPVIEKAYGAGPCPGHLTEGFLNEGLPYRVPYPQTTPVQESGPARPIPSGIC
ncbi:phospholipase C3 PlcC [Mycobacterium tuberculosis UT0084]|nr:phospholipase C3 PlcC [Mycobacterium tuberculosis UT0084]KBM78608.1 phospholipase C3 PlcC [Mycobacterium tuberculosis KT-0082]KCH39612.1 phospholipase C3 PlcC [Mycobacterium tuberculosis KT-0109]MCE4186744.1 hypothetical protein [Mycobacterium tuberculosis]